MTSPYEIVAGPREAVMAEVGTPDIYKGKYLVQPVGRENWDAEGFNTMKEARAHIQELKTAWPAAVTLWLR